MCESTWTGAGDEVFEVMLISREKCSRWAFVTRKHDRSVLPLWFMFRQQITEPQTSWRCARCALGDGEWHNLNRYATYLCCWYEEMWRISAAESCRLFIEDKITSSAKSNVLFSHSELSGLLLLNKKKTAVTTEACGSYRCEQVKSGLDADPLSLRQAEKLSSESFSLRQQTSTKAQRCRLYSWRHNTKRSHDHGTTKNSWLFRFFFWDSRKEKKNQLIPDSPTCEAGFSLSLPEVTYVLVNTPEEAEHDGPV